MVREAGGLDIVLPLASSNVPWMSDLGLFPKPIDFAALRAEIDRCIAQWRAAP